VIRSAGHNTVRFGEFSFDLDTARLYRGPSLIKLEPQPTKLLQRMLQARGGIVSREEARLAVWGTDTHVDFDQGLAYGIRRIRRALVDEGTNSKYIETIPREGYRMLAAVEFLAPAAATLPRPEPPRAEIPPPMRHRPWRWLAPVAVTCLIALTIFFLWSGKNKRAPAAAQPKSIVVIPFTNLDGDPNDDYLGAGLSEDILTQLAAGGRAAVIKAPEAAGHDPVAVSKHVNAQLVVDGSIRRDGKHFVVTAHLVDGATGQVYWTQAFERDANSIVRLQRDIAGAVASLIGSTLQRGFASRNPAAVDHYWRGVYALSRTGDGLTFAIKSMQEAIRLDPDYPEALAGLAVALCRQGTFVTLRVRDAAKEAEPYAERAAQLAPDLSESEEALGNVSFDSFRRRKAAVHLWRALHLNPRNEEARAVLIYALSTEGRFEEARAAASEGLALNPLSIGVRHSLALSLQRSRHYEEALTEANRVLEIDPSYQPTHRVKAEAFAMLGRFEEARVAYLKGTEGMSTARIEAALAYVAAAAGEPDLVQQHFRRSQATKPAAYFFPKIYSILGDTRQAMRLLEESVDLGLVQVHFLKVEPAYDNVRRDPKYAALLRRAGFE
jgi:TolB-like protein/DNA-binding winged helix-turn-helix (wHTH) protein/Flp pilus assembly protein TadD